MAQLGVNFDASRVQPLEAGLPIWEGRVPVTIMRTEIKPTNANDGNSMLVFHVKALDAPYAGQDNAVRLNLYNKNAQAVEIAQRSLSSMCHVTGKMNVTDSDQLIGVPFITVWAKESRELTDQATGAKRNIDGCQCKDFQLIDGRTIKEAMAGQAASSPYVPGVTGVQEAAARAAMAGAGSPSPQTQQGGFAPAPQSQTGMQPAAPGNFGAPGGQQAQPGFQPPTQQPAAAPQAGFAPPNGAMHAPGQGGTQPGSQPGFGTVASPSNQQAGGFAPPAGGQGGFGGAPGYAGQAPGAAGPQPGGFGAPQTQQGGFGVPGQQAQQPQQGFQPPQPGQAGAGPWGGAPQGGQGGFGPR